MHPILGRAGRLALYLVAWLALCVLVAGIFTRFGLDWTEALALLAPLCLVYAFVCLSAWYVSRAVPLTPSGAASRAGVVGAGGGVRQRAVARPRASLDRRARSDDGVCAGGRAVRPAAAVPVRHRRAAVPARARGALRAAGVRGGAPGRAPTAGARDPDARRRAAGAARADRSALPVQQPQLDQRADRQRRAGRTAHVPAARRVPPHDAGRAARASAFPLPRSSRSRNAT